jgi:hypothetical protein
MKTGLRLAFALVAVVTVASTALAAGCTSSGGGSSGSGTSQYCSALASYASRCNITDPCTQASVQNCATYAGTYSSAWLGAVAQCAAEATCVDGGGTAATSCIQGLQASLAPSAAQEKLAEDYCALCATSAHQSTAQCTAGFYQQPGDGSLGGPGAFYLEYSDTIASSIDTQCVPKLADAGLFGCDLPMILCADPIITKSYPSIAACSTTVDAGVFTFDASGILPSFDASGFFDQ